MFCPDCNKENAEGLDFCTECGKRLTVDGKAPKKGKLNKKKAIIIGIIAVFAVCVIAYFAGYLTPAGSSAEDVAISSVEAYLNFDHETTLSLFPEEYTSWVADKYYGGNLDGFEQMLESKADKNELAFKTRYGPAWSYSDITVSSVREYSASEISALNDDFDGMGLDIKVKAAQKVKLKYTITYLSNDDKRVAETIDSTAFVVNIGGKWYLFDE